MKGPPMKKWLHTHPVLSCFFTAVIVFVSTAYWMLWLLHEPFSPLDVVPYLFLAFGIWMAVRGTRKAVVLLVAAGSLLSTPAKAQEDFKPAAALWVGGAVVLGVGSWIAYKIISCGQRIAASRATNSPPEEFVAAGEAGEVGAAFFWPEYCSAERLAPAIPTVFTLNIFVTSRSNCAVTVRADSGWQSVETFDEFKEFLETHALSVPAFPSFYQCYERNRQPADPKDVPLSFNFETRTLTAGPGGILVIVESSKDLREWSSVARCNVAAGAHIELPDVSSEHRFYRVSTQ